MFCHQHQPSYRPHCAPPRTPARRTYHSATEPLFDRDIPRQHASRQQLQLKSTQAQTEHPLAPQILRPTISSFLAPPGAEKHYNPHETIADSLTRPNRPAAGKESTITHTPAPYHDLSTPCRTMREALKSNSPNQIWDLYKQLTTEWTATYVSPFSYTVYFQMLRRFKRANTATSATWARTIYEDMKRYRCINIQIVNVMLDILLRHEDVDKSIELFQRDVAVHRLSPDIWSYNTMIRGLCVSGRLNDAEKIYNDLRAGVLLDRPDVTTYSTLMSQYRKSGMQDEADKVLDDMLKDNIKPNIYIYNSVIKRFVKQKDYVGARRAMTLMKSSNVKPDVVTYTTLIDGYARDGNEEAIANIQTEMAANKVYPDTKTITSTIKVFARSSLNTDIDSSLASVLNSLSAEEMNEFTFGVLMNVYGKRKDLDAAMGIYQHMTSKGREVNYVIACSLLDGCIRADQVPTANKIFHEYFTARGIRPPNAWAYSIMITGCCKQRNLSDALHYYHEMSSFQIEPDAISCSRLIQLYLDHHQLDNAQQMLRLMRNSKFAISVHTYTMLMDYMSGVKDTRGALRYYREMLESGVEPDVYCYTVLINVYLRGGTFAACDATYEQMIKRGVKPALETLTSMMQAHSIQGHVERVKEYWAAMIDMELLPDVQSFTVLMKTYSQLGNVEMVEFIYKEVLRKSVKIDTTLLTTLISAYDDLPRLNVGRIDEIADVMEEQELEPTPVYYRTLLDMYGKHGMPDRVVKTWRQLQSLEKPLDFVPSTSNFLYLIEACRDRGYIDVLHSAWRAATTARSHPAQDEVHSSRQEHSSPTILEPLPAATTATMVRPAPEVFAAYLNALLTHNRFNEIEGLLKEGCQKMRMMPRTEDLELLFTGLAQYDFLKKEMESIRQIVVEQWPWTESMVSKVIQNTRRI
ncbi:hypothetical protein BGZ58_010216 [Dissophora ornata]|nr:hypothetical protein BGZ58_010216 [Dissophora ornata]